MEIYFAGNKKVFADINDFTIKTDQNPRSGGDGEFPEPFTMFLASLGPSAGLYPKVFREQRGIPPENIKLTQEQKIDPIRKMIGDFELNIAVPSDFPEKYEKALIHTASLCAVKKHLSEDIDVQVNIVRS